MTSFHKKFLKYCDVTHFLFRTKNLKEKTWPIFHMSIFRIHIYQIGSFCVVTLNMASNLLINIWTYTHNGCYFFLCRYETTKRPLQFDSTGSQTTQKHWRHNSLVPVTWQSPGSQDLCRKYGRNAWPACPWRHVPGCTLWTVFITACSGFEFCVVSLVLNALFFRLFCFIACLVCWITDWFLEIHSELLTHWFRQRGKYLLVSEKISHVGSGAQRKHHRHGRSCSRGQLRKTSGGRRKASENGRFARVSSTRGS